MKPKPQSTIDRYCGSPETAVMVIDDASTVAWASSNFVDIIGRPSDEVIGETASSWLHPSDLTTFSLFVNNLPDAFGSTFRLRLRLTSSDGAYVLSCCTFVNHLYDDDIDGIVVVIQRSNVATLGDEGVAIRIDDPDRPISANPLAPLIQSLTDGVVTSDDSGMVFAGELTTDLMGWPADELFASYADLFHADDQPALMKFFTDIATTDGKAVETRVRILHRDGGWRSFQMRSINLMADEDYATIVTLLHDDSSDGHGEQLDDQQLQLRQAINLAADPVLVVDPEGTVRFATTPSAELWQRPLTTILMQPLLELVAADHREALQDWLARGDADRRLHAELLRSDGSRRWATLSKTFVDDAELPANVVLSVHDVHDQMLTEQAMLDREARFETLVRNAPGCVVVLDEDDRISYAAPSIERELLLRADGVTGMRLDAVVHADDRPSLGRALTEVRGDGNAPAVTCRLSAGDGTTRYFEIVLADHRRDRGVTGIVANLRDRTTEVTSELALLDSERRYKALVQHSFEVTIVLDSDLTVRWISPSVEELLGWRAESLTGANAYDYIHPDDTSLVAENLELALSGSKARPFTVVRIRERAGAWKYVVASVADRRDDPDVGGLIINLRDATVQVANERALEASESRYRTLIQNSTDVVQIMNASGKVMWISPAVETVLGYKPEQLVESSTGALEGLAGREELVRSFLKVLQIPGGTARCVSRVQHADQSWRWIDVVLVNHLDQPEILGVVATYRDITERIENEQARRASEERFRSLAESSPLGIFQLDLGLQCTYVNDRWCEITGQSVAESQGDGWRTTIRRGSGQFFELDVDRHPSGEPTPEIQLVRADGESRWCALHFAPLTDDHGERIGSVGTIDDVTSTVNARHEAKRLSTILETTPDLVLLFVPTGTLVYLNGAACDFFQVDPDEDLSGTPVSAVLPEENIELWHSAIHPALERNEPWQGETTVRNRVGDVIPISAVVIAHRDAAGEIEMVSITARDMSERKALEARLHHQATHDPLTGLPNRTLLLDRLEVAMGRARRNEGTLAVLFLDLDHFKVVNDSLGHGTGDVLLTALASRLSDLVRPGDTVARFGGDEFVIVCEDLEQPEEAQVIAMRIAEAMSEPVKIAESEVVVTASVGIALVDRLHKEPDQVLRDADAAMYQAKARGRDQFAMFDPRFRTHALARLEVENSLRQALARDELVVHYQPVFDIKSGTAVGCEALVRWDHPERALLLPSEFLGVAEESGLIVPIGEWVLRQACLQTRRLIKSVPGLDHFDVAVNLSARQISNAGLVDQITRIIDETEMDPGDLTLEITESIMMDDVVLSSETLTRLRALGIHLAIDDFGTGYSSLAYLQRFPVDVLKIDRSFVTGLGQNEGDAAITEAIISMSHALDLRVVAEGVETKLQHDLLSELGCDRAQGFLLSRPLNPVALELFLKDEVSERTRRRA